MTGVSAQHSWNPDLSLLPLELLLSLYSHSDVTMYLWVCGERRDGFFTRSWGGDTEGLVHAGLGLCPCCASSLVVVPMPRGTSSGVRKCPLSCTPKQGAPHTLTSILKSGCD